jgi:hypothetical protein
MFNDRPLQDARTQAVLDQILTLMRAADLAGGVYVVNAHEMGFGYPLYTTWNAIIEDPTLPMSWRIRAKSTDLGAERAQALVEGTAWTFGAMRDFGRQCEQWGKEMMQILRRAGLGIHYTPFGGARLPHIGGVDMREPGHGR